MELSEAPSPTSMPYLPAAKVDDLDAGCCRVSPSAMGQKAAWLLLILPGLCVNTEEVLRTGYQVTEGLQ